MSASPYSSHAAPPVNTSSRINVSRNERIASAVGGGLLALWGMRRFSVPGLLTAAVGGALLYRGATGHCPGYERLGLNTAPPSHRVASALEVDEAVTVNKPRDEIYAFWRDVENLPRFMHHLASVEVLGDDHSQWTARAPRGLGAITWEAEVMDDEPGEHLAWRSLPGADVHNAGMVRFTDAPEGRGTEVHVRITYRPPAGDVGTLVADLIQPANKQMIKDDVRRFKQVIEAGEVAQVEGQPTGPR